MSSSVSADDSVVDEINITVPTSCSLEGTGMTSHNANIVNGTYQGDIGSTTLKAFCNDADGFAIYAIGYTDNEYGKTVLTNTTLGSTHDIVTGTATSGNTSNWAMKLATVTNPTPTYPITLDNSFNAYHNVPSSYTKVAHRDSGTDIGTNAAGASLTSTYAAFMSQTQPAGTYTGQVKYTLVHPSSAEAHYPVACEAGKICYNANTGIVVGEMGKQSANNNASIILYAPNFKRDGYGFAGWNDAFDYSGTYYGPNQTITAPSDIQTNGLSIYAVWIKSAGTLQNWTGCSNLANGATTALTDSRDGNTYAVAKLADGKCWMIENLRLADKDGNNNDIILSSNTHNPSLPLTNIYDSGTTSNHLSPTSSVAYNATTAPEGWCNTDSAACDNQSRLRTDNTVLFTNNTASSYSAESNNYIYGNYYNWYSATGGHGKHGDDYSSSYNAPGDICPAGWHLPTGNTTGEYYALNTILNAGATNSTASNNVRSYPNNFVYSGNVSYASIRNRYSYGGYWSTSGASSSGVYSMTFGGTYVNPGTSSIFKYAGMVIRCIANN